MYVCVCIYSIYIYINIKISNHQNKKKLLKCFTLHVMNLKYMKVSLFEIS